MKIVEESIFGNYEKNEVLVCPVNLVGVMGKGLVLKFKREFPWAEERYKIAVESEMLGIGRNVYTGTVPSILYMATKRHWRDNSRKEDVVAGLLDLKKLMKKHPELRIRLPAVGCGEGNLSFEWLVEQCWTLFSGMDVTLYTPWAGDKR